MKMLLSSRIFLQKMCQSKLLRNFTLCKQQHSVIIRENSLHVFKWNQLVHTSELESFTATCFDEKSEKGIKSQNLCTSTVWKFANFSPHDILQKFRQINFFNLTKKFCSGGKFPKFPHCDFCAWFLNLLI